MTTEQKLASAIQAVEDTLAHHKAIFTNGVALTARAETARLGFMNRIQSTSGDGTPLNIDRGWPEIENILSLDAAAKYLSTQAIAAAVSTSTEYIEAVAILEPLIAEVRQLESQLLAETQLADIQAAERRDAIQAATEKALAAVAAQFPEPAPPVAPAPPFRGRVKIEQPALV